MSEDLDNAPEELLAHVEWLRRLARTLVDDGDQADDAMQDACLSALERPPASWSAPRAWLATVLRRNASGLDARRGRRAAAERLASRPEALPSAAYVAEQLSIHRELVDAVRRLEEPYRSSVVLRYFHGLAPAEIARRSGVPAGTVRARISRALERIRADLDRRHGGRRAWCAALMALAAAPDGAATKTLVTGVLAMKKITVVVAVAAVLILLAGAMLIWSDEPEPELDAGSQTASARVASDPRRTVPAPEEAGAAADASTPEAPADVRAPAGVPVPHRRGFLVRCLDADGAPVEGAWVAVAEGDEVDRLAAVRDPARWRGKYGGPKRTDARGEVEVAGDKRAAHVVAAGPGGLFGRWSRSGLVDELAAVRSDAPLGFDADDLGAAAAWEDDNVAVEITLTRHDSLVVRAVDPGGAVCGRLPLIWRSLEVGGKRRSRWKKVRTDGAGLAAIRRTPDERSQPLEVRARIIAREPPRLVIAAAAESDEPHTLEVPFLGSVTARVVDRLGEPLQFNRLYASLHDRPSYDHAVSGRLEARFEHVEVGLMLHLRARTLGGDAEEVAAGPRAAGEHVEVALRADESAVIVAGRLLAPGGEPLARRRFILSLAVPRREGGDAVTRWSRFTTTSDGRFRTALTAQGKAPPSGSVVGFKGIADHDDASRDVLDELAGERPLPAPSAQGVADLGDVTLSPLPVLVAGRVVDESGRGLPGAVVDVSLERKGPGEDIAIFLARDRGTSVTNLGPMSISVSDRGWQGSGNTDFRVVRIAVAPRCDEEGRFAVRGSRADDLALRLGLRASKLGFVQVEKVVADVGRADVVIEMRKGFLVTGQVTGVRRFDALDARLVVGDGGEGFPLPIDDRGKLATRRQLAVPAAVCVRLRPTGDELLRRRVEPPSDGRAVVDVGVLDVSTLLTEIVVTAVDAAGGRIPGVHVLRSSATGSRTWRAVASSDGEGVTVTFRAGERPRLRLEALGFEPREVTAAATDMTVTLDRAPAVTFRINDAGTLPLGGARLRVTLARGGGGSWSTVGDPADLRGGTARFATEGPGAYRLRIEVVLGAGDDERAADVFSDFDDWPEIVVTPDGGDDQLLAISLDPGAVTEACRALR